MNQKVEEGKTLLVDGPAAVTVTSGKVEVFGMCVRKDHRIVVREGKRLPFFAEETSNLSISLGENASLKEVEGDTVPSSWVETFGRLIQLLKRPVVTMVIGKTDSGKTSFCTYLINRLFSHKKRIAILDGDLGQTEIGPPGTVSYAFVSEPLTEMYNMKLRNGFFVGSTSPNGALDKILEGMILMKSEITNESADFVIINTDGWVEGEEALKYKVKLAEKLEPDVVFFVQQKDELQPLITALKKFTAIILESPQVAKQRDTAKRKNLRDLNYAKYLAGAKLKAMPLNYLKIEKENAMANKLKEEKGLLLGLQNNHRRFLGIGILINVDLARKTLRVLTSVSEKPAIITFGKVTLDENFRETSIMLPYDNVSG